MFGVARVQASAHPSSNGTNFPSPSRPQLKSALPNIESHLSARKAILPQVITNQPSTQTGIAVPADKPITSASSSVSVIPILHFLPGDDDSRTAVLTNGNNACANLEWKNIPGTRKLNTILSAVKRKWAAVPGIESIRLRPFLDPKLTNGAKTLEWNLENNPITLQEIHMQLGFPMPMVCFYSFKSNDTMHMTSQAATVTSSSSIHPSPSVVSSARHGVASVNPGSNPLSASVSLNPTPVPVPILSHSQPSRLPTIPPSTIPVPLLPNIVAYTAAAVAAAHPLLIAQSAGKLPTPSNITSSSLSSTSAARSLTSATTTLLSSSKPKSLLPPSTFSAYSSDTASWKKKQSHSTEMALPTPASTDSSVEATSADMLQLEHATNVPFTPRHTVPPNITTNEPSSNITAPCEDDGLPSLPTILPLPPSSSSSDSPVTASNDMLESFFGESFLNDEFVPLMNEVPTYPAQTLITPSLQPSSSSSFSTPRRSSSTVKKSLFADFSASSIALSSPFRPTTVATSTTNEVTMAAAAASSVAENSTPPSLSTPSRSPLGTLYSSSVASANNIAANLTPSTSQAVNPRLNASTTVVTTPVPSSAAASIPSVIPPAVSVGKENVAPPLPPSPTKTLNNVMLAWMGDNSSMAVFHALNPSTIPPISSDNITSSPPSATNPVLDSLQTNSPPLHPSSAVASVIAAFCASTHSPPTSASKRSSTKPSNDNNGKGSTRKRKEAPSSVDSKGSTGSSKRQRKTASPANSVTSTTSQKEKKARKRKLADGDDGERKGGKKQKRSRQSKSSSSTGGVEDDSVVGDDWIDSWAEDLDLDTDGTESDHITLSPSSGSENGSPLGVRHSDIDSPTKSLQFTPNTMNSSRQDDENDSARDATQEASDLSNHFPPLPPLPKCIIESGCSNASIASNGWTNDEATHLPLDQLPNDVPSSFYPQPSDTSDHPFNDITMPSDPHSSDSSYPSQPAQLYGSEQPDWLGSAPPSGSFNHLDLQSSLHPSPPNPVSSSTPFIAVDLDSCEFSLDSDLDAELSVACRNDPNRFLQNCSSKLQDEVKHQLQHN